MSTLETNERVYMYNNIMKRKYGLNFFLEWINYRERNVTTELLRLYLYNILINVI